MKKNISLLIIFLICVIVILFFANSNDNFFGENITSQDLTTLTSEQDPFEIEHSSVNKSTPGSSNYVSADVISPEPEKMMLTYNGFPIQIEYQFNCEKACTMGLMIFVNGILQPYKIVSNDEETTMYTIEMNDNETKRFKFEFTPICGKKDEELVVIFANVYNAKVMELTGDINTFGNNQRIFQPLPWTLILNEDCKTGEQKISTDYEKQTMSKKEISEFVRVDYDGNRRNLLDNACMVEIRKNNTLLSSKTILNTKDDNELNIYAYGNMTGRYRLSLYGDFNQLSINGYDYIEVDVFKDTYTIIPFSNINEYVSIYKNIFVVLAPMEFENGLEKSQSIYITVK